jgi:hypothetical protein
MRKRLSLSKDAGKPGTPSDVVRRLFNDVLSGASPDAAPKVVDQNVVIHGAYPQDITGIASLRKLVATYQDTLQTIRISADSTIEIGDIVVCRWSARGKIANVWPLPVVKLDIPGAVSTFRLRNSRIIEIWALDISFDPSDYEEDDDDGPVGSAPPGPRWVPPEPTSKPRASAEPERGR